MTDEGNDKDDTAEGVWHINRATPRHPRCLKKEVIQTYESIFTFHITYITWTYRRLTHTF